MKTKLALIAATLFASQLAVAAEWPDNAVYAGVGVGQSKLKGDVADFVNSIPGSDFDDKDTSGKVFIGKQFNRNFGVEATYGYLGHYTASNRFHTATAQARSLGLDAVLTLPLTQKFSVLGKAGVARTRVDGGIDGFSDRGHSTDPHFGLGASYAFTDKVALRGEVERQRVKFDDVKSHINTASLSLVYKFGNRPVTRTVETTRTTYTPPAVVAAPVYQTPAAPAPVETTTTVKKVRE